MMHESNGEPARTVTEAVAAARAHAARAGKATKEQVEREPADSGGRPRLLERDAVRIPLDREGLQALFEAVIRHGWTIIAFVAATFVAVVIHAQLSAPDYVARASVIVKLGREFQHSSNLAVDRSGSMYRLEEAINSVIEILESRGLVKGVVQDISVAQLFPKIDEENLSEPLKQEKSIDAFRERLKVRGIADSSVIEATFEHSDREVGVKALDSLLEHLDERQLEVFSGTGMAVLQGQLSRVERDFRASADALRQFQQESGVFDVDHQVQILLSQRSQAEQKLDEANLRHEEILNALPASMARALDGDSILPVHTGDEIASDDGSLEDLTQNLPSPVTFKDNRALSEAHAQLLALQVEARRLSSQYSPDGRRLTSMREEMALLRDFMFGAAEDELMGQRALITSLEARTAELDAKMSRLLEQGNALRELQSQHVANEAIYQEYLGRVEAARIDAELDRQKESSIAILDPASAPVDPGGIPLGTRVILSLLVGIGLGLIAIVVRERYTLFG